ncbi:hypothetical protein SLEP1_g52750 [Rubroshorea leprosula]|uniref:Uncharacterized protein n=1 Tax=Rubroshorea leprosula TaxID=152421 RepID=A0AAV5M8C6_9ROSI|nr:hypothetical protein SLEP1_g52750 [Rubroshorea leprosula]
MGVEGPEPNGTLMENRSDKVLHPNQKQKVKIYCGQNFYRKDNISEGKRERL